MRQQPDKRMCGLHGLVIGAVAALMLTASLCPAQSRDRGFGRRDDALDERYSAVVDNNIFLRERGRRPVRVFQPSSRPARPQRTVEQSLMLTGIVFEEDTVRAYFENLAGGEPVRVAPGETVGHGMVVEIAIDAVAYQNTDGIVRWVEIGQDLTGASASAASSLSPSFGTAPTDVTAASSGSTGDAGGGEEASSETTAATEGSADPSTMSVLERMRRNRQQQLNRN